MPANTIEIRERPRASRSEYSSVPAARPRESAPSRCDLLENQYGEGTYEQGAGNTVGRIVEVGVPGKVEVVAAQKRPVVRALFDGAVVLSLVEQQLELELLEELVPGRVLAMCRGGVEPINKPSWTVDDTHHEVNGVADVGKQDKGHHLPPRLAVQRCNWYPLATRQVCEPQSNPIPRWNGTRHLDKGLRCGDHILGESNGVDHVGSGPSQARVLERT
jgi:hypothetical protein